MKTRRSLRSSVVSPAAARLARRTGLAGAAAVESLEPRQLLSTVLWDGGPSGLGTNFHDPVNWDGDTLPGAADDAVISVAADPVITITSSTSVNSITSDEATSQSGGTLTIAAASVFNGAYSLTGGTVTGAGNFAFNAGLTFNSAVMSGTGISTVPAGQVLTMDGGSRNVFRTLEVFGTTVWSSGNILMNGGLFANRAGAVFNASLASTAFIWVDYNAGPGTPGTFLNEGTFNKTGAGAAYFTHNFGGILHWTNAATGVFNVDGGILGLQALGTSTNSGTIDVDAGTTLRLLGTGVTHTSGSSVTGAGALTSEEGTQTFAAGSSYTLTGTILASGGSLTFQTGTPTVFPSAVSVTGATVTFSTGTSIAFPALFTLTGGTVTGIDNLTFNAGLTFNSAVMSGTGISTVPAGQVLTMNGGGRNLFRTMEVFGTTVWSSGNILMNGGLFANRAGAVFNASLASTAFIWVDYNAGPGTPGTFLNEGTFNKTGAGAAYFTHNFGGILHWTNAATGVFNVDGGILGLQALGTSTNSGTIDVDAGTTLRLLGTGVTHTSGSSVTGAGALTSEEGTQTFAAGSSYTLTGTILASGGSLTFQTGTPTVFPSAVSVTGATVTFSTGTSIAFPALFTLTGGTVTGIDNLTFNAGLTFNSAVMSGTGISTVPAGQVLTMNGGGRNLFRTMEVFGTTVWSSGNILMNGGLFANRAGAVFNASLASTAFIWVDYNAGPGTPGTFLNEGTFNKTGAGAAYFTHNFGGILHWTNAATGVFNVDGGILGLQALGTSTNSGTIDVDAGTTLRLLGTGVTHTSGSSVTGAGALTSEEGTQTFAAGSSYTLTGTILASGGSLTFQTGTPTVFPSAVSVTGATVTFSTGTSIAFPALFTLTGGTVTGIDNLTFNAGLTFNSAVMSGTGISTVPAGQVLTMNGGGRNLFRTMEVFGTTVWSSGNILMNGGLFANRLGAVFNATLASTAFIWVDYNAGPGTPGTFLNEGTFNKTGAATVWFTGNFGGILHWTNAASGVFNVDQGTLGLQAMGTISNAGTLAVDAGAAADFFFSPIQVSGSSLTGGTWIIAGTCTFPGPSITDNFGTIILIGPAASFVGIGSLTNNFASGLVELRDGAPFSFVPIGGTFNNLGLLRKSGTLTTTIAASVTLNNTGTVEVTGNTLVVAAAPTQANGGILTAGTWRILDGSALDMTTANLVTSNATVVIDGSGADFLGLEDLTTNNGSLTIRDGADFFFTPLLNRFQNNGTFIAGGAGRGIGLVTVPGGIAFDTGASSLTQVRGGRLQLLGGGSQFGLFDLNGGEGLDLAGTHQLNGNTSFTGAGEVRNTGAMVREVAGLTDLAPGVAFDNPGMLDVRAGEVRMRGPIEQVVGDTLMAGTWCGTDPGTITMPGQIRTNNGWIMLSGPGAIFDAINPLHTNSGTLAIIDGRNFAAQASFTNTSLFTVGTGSLFTVALGAMTNSGLLILSDATLSATAGGSHTGDFALMNNADLILGGNHAVAASSDLTGNGSITFQSGTSTINGTINVTGAVRFQGNNETINGAFSAGVVQIDAPSTVTFNTDPAATTSLTNDGTLVLGTHTFTVGAGGFTQSDAATLTLSAAGAADYGNIASSGPASVDGDVNLTVVNPYFPLIGTRFDIITGAARTGTFDSISPTGVPDTVYSPVYTPTKVQLLYTSASDTDQDGVVTPLDVALFINRWSQSLTNGDLAGDFNHDGIVNSVDIALYINQWFAALNP